MEEEKQQQDLVSLENCIGDIGTEGLGGREGSGQRWGVCVQF